MEGQYCFRSEPIGDQCLRLWRKISCGGFGEIYRAKSTRWGMDVAVKLLYYKDGSSSSIQREAQLMFQAQNPNVIRVLGLYEGRLGDSQLPLRSGLVMELMPRGSLADLLRRLSSRPPWPLTFRCAHQISLGMNFLHQSSPPILHLDLKPSNVLLDDSLNAKITDFGLSRVARSVSRYSREKDEDEGGTLSYMPPEALESVNYKANTACDVYSYGILLWSIITGKEPYSNAPSTLVRFRIPRGDRPDLELVDRTATAGLDELVTLMTECWSQKAEGRPSFLECVATTEQINEMYKPGLNDAVHDVIKELDDEICSCLKSLQMSSKTQNEAPQDQSCVTGPFPQQETAPSYSKMVNKDEFLRPAPAVSQSHQVFQRQTSTPGGIHFSGSNIFGVQIGSNNTMNIVGSGRHRHLTAPSSYSQSESALRKPQ